MRIIEILLPKGTSDRSLSPQQARKIDALQKRMDSYVDKIMDPNTSVAGKDFLKARLRSDLEELKDVLPVAESIQINELFRSPSNWEWGNTGPSRAVADFTVGEIPYKFSATLENTEDKSWTILFRTVSAKSLSKEYGISGTGNASVVFSTVLDIMKSFLDTYKGMVDKLIFSADEPSRQKLYQHMIERLLPDAQVERKGYDFIVTLPHAVKDKKQISEAVTKLPLTTDDFELVKLLMDKPIPAAIAPIYIHQIIEDDEFNEQLASLEESQPGLDVRPLIAEWFNRVMPDQMYRFTGEVPNYHQKNGTLSLIHGYDSHDYKGTNDPLTGVAYGRF